MIDLTKNRWLIETMKLFLCMLAAFLLSPALLYSEQPSGVTIKFSYIDIVPQNDAERTMLYYRDGKMKEYYEMIKKHGPNIKMESEFLCDSILGVAAMRDDVRLVKQLLSLGADVAICKNGPVRSAVYQVSLESLEVLLKAGAPVDALDRHGVRPMEIALEEFPFFSNYNPEPGSSSRAFAEQQIALIELLIKYGADLSHTTRDGSTYSDFFKKKFENSKPLHSDYDIYLKRVLAILNKK